eukprot:TRINITY_DN18516_c0_g1_i1.p1 TRINITY_DN18516_c0_g1~~TRINITY_DN18516_c0_g1_i1.p1  ORF type:complete len:178 (-),score=29.31 TRINITY_DN18516_c0_g1_i1:52-585(-)
MNKLFVLSLCLMAAAIRAQDCEDCMDLDFETMGEWTITLLGDDPTEDPYRIVKNTKGNIKLFEEGDNVFGVVYHRTDGEPFCVRQVDINTKCVKSIQMDTHYDPRNPAFENPPDHPNDRKTSAAGDKSVTHTSFTFDKPKHNNVAFQKIMFIQSRDDECDKRGVAQGLKVFACEQKP